MKTTRLAHAHAVRVLRRLGRELVDGSWSERAAPLSEPAAAVVMSRALMTVVEVGIGTVVDAVEDRIRELLGD